MNARGLDMRGNARSDFDLKRSKSQVPGPNYTQLFLKDAEMQKYPVNSGLD
jgi:hypothetical protein